MEQESRGWRWERGGRSEAPGCTPGSNRSTRPSLCPSIPALDGPFKAPRSCSPHPHPPPHKAPTGPKGVPSAGGRWAEHPPRGGLGGGSRSRGEPLGYSPRGEGPYREAGPARPDPPRSGNGHREGGSRPVGPQLHRPPKDGAGSRCRFPCTGFPCTGSRSRDRFPVPHPGCTGRAERTQL